ncbi:MAG: hydrogenase maturation nickel metallochaperone HypA [Acidimicrobiia bacterium]
MHERALISSAAWELLGRVGEAMVTSVTLAIGPETDPAVVAQAWSSATHSTPLEGATLNAVTRPHLLVCLECGREYEGDKLSKCPACAGNGLVIKTAPEVELETWTLSEGGT